MLEKINSPRDLDGLSVPELKALCGEIREFLLKSVSETGGHLASNLGIAELTVAIHREFELSRDRLVFDVGHQCYVHKILTGRREKFSSLRKLGGISGFPKPEESEYDAFIAGHASNSVSVALGLARARTMRGETHNVLALVGDGALTGGLAYEALCDAGGAGEPLIVILNDNGMSITKNVGGMARYLARLRLKPQYIRFKKLYRRVLERLPGGRALYRLTHTVKTALKHALLHCSMFEEMGFQYIGPVDGHDIGALIGALRRAKAQDAPALIHAVTQKGRGYAPSEATPDIYHGVSVFDVESGVCGRDTETFSSVFGKTLAELAEREGRIVAVTAAMASGTGLGGFAERFPGRLLDVGIAEGHAVAMSAGLAAGGMLPVFAVYSTFLQRSYDMLLHDIALSGARAVFAVDRAGIVPGDGETHQGIFDTAFLSTVPGMKIYAPASLAELRDMLTRAILLDTGAVAVRYPKGAEGAYRGGGAEPSKRLREGSGVTLVTYGIMANQALAAAEALARNGISTEVIKLGVISPLDTGDIERSAAKTGALVIIEDSAEAGSVGERVLARLASRGAAPCRAEILSVGARNLPGGSAGELRRLCGIDAEGICAAVMEVCHAKNAS
ncbi:MAG: 1-deoxy-D-xylulose-5-phosphate synthase [Oscillospiraceae bacterium]|jgi:1-deoxy-D-xylulose-5-phosphate synthase|nr:1-deoxy-D-xylulose-5-phosphate synthase [Oscillospiraceae bacterium]